VLANLLFEFAAGIKKTQTVIIGLRQKFHTAGSRERIECAYHLGGIFGKLFKQHAGYTVGYPEFTLMLFYQVQYESVCGKVAFICNLAANCPVLEIVKIPPVCVEDRIMSKSAGLMNLKVKTN
jgi:hypothetical protein